VLHCLVSDVDFVAGTTKCDVRFRASEPGDGGYVAGPTNGHRQATTLTIVSHARTWSE
jgi:hypothetical protein